MNIHIFIVAGILSLIVLTIIGLNNPFVPTAPPNTEHGIKAQIGQMGHINMTIDLKHGQMWEHYRANHS